jgi:hypothetical protein
MILSTKMRYCSNKGEAKVWGIKDKDPEVTVIKIKEKQEVGSLLLHFKAINTISTITRWIILDKLLEELLKWEIMDSNLYTNNSVITFKGNREVKKINNLLVLLLKIHLEKKYRKSKRSFQLIYRIPLSKKRKIRIYWTMKNNHLKITYQLPLIKEWL